MYHQLPLFNAVLFMCTWKMSFEFLIGISTTTEENKKIWKKMVWEHGRLSHCAILNRHMDIFLLTIFSPADTTWYHPEVCRGLKCQHLNSTALDESAAFPSEVLRSHLGVFEISVSVSIEIQFPYHSLTFSDESTVCWYLSLEIFQEIK